MYIKHILVSNYISQQTYDYIKYGGKTNAKLDTFTKRKDRYFFHKLSKRFNERDVLDFFVSNFIISVRQVGSDLITNESIENYTRYRKYNESF